MTRELDIAFQGVLAVTLQEMEENKRLSGNRLTQSQLVLRKFFQIAAEMTATKYPNQKLQAEQIPEKATQLLELFATGLLKAMYVATEACVSDDDYKPLLENVAMDIYEEAERLVSAGYGTNQADANRLTKHQEDTIKQKASLYIVSSITKWLQPSLIQNPSQSNSKKPESDKQKKFDKYQLDQLFATITQLSMPFSSLSFYLDHFRSPQQWPTDKELILHHPVWFLLAWAGPFLSWAVFHISLLQLLDCLPWVPLVGITGLWISSWVRKGLFHSTAESLLLVVLLNSLVIFMGWFEAWLILLAHLEILLIFIFGFGLQQEINKQLNEIAQIKASQSGLIDPSHLYKKLVTDCLSLRVGEKLIPMADPTQEGELVSRISKLRERMAIQFGYIIPSVHIQDSRLIEPNEYELFVHEQLVAKGCIYPGRYLLTEDVFHRANLMPPESAIIDVEPIFGIDKAYWLPPSEISDTLQRDSKSAAQVIIEHLQIVALRHVNTVFSHLDAQKVLEVARRENEQLFEDLARKRLETTVLRQVFTNLLREQVSIKDIGFILERLLEYSIAAQTFPASPMTFHPDTLSEHLRSLLGRSICLQHASKQRQLEVIELSPSWNERLQGSLVQDIMGIHFNLSPTDKMELIESITTTISRIRQRRAYNPILVCSTKIRLPLFRLLESHIPELTILAYEEIIPEVMTVGLESI